ncbi:MAG TPA: hypothetical protein PLY30_04120, partial [Candidatus Omnitrophota bacterium]|nr:hypothetical protein [Candidatus Omnitrophota bacterium]
MFKSFIKKNKKLARRFLSGKFPFHGFERVARFEEDEPFEILGPHAESHARRMTVRAFFPRAAEAWVRLPGEDRRQAM